MRDATRTCGAVATAQNDMTNARNGEMRFVTDGIELCCFCSHEPHQVCSC